MGADEVALIGGEAYLHPAFLDVLGALRDAGLRATMVTGGRGVTRALAKEMAARGIYSVSVSVDGLRETHDLIRAARGSFESANAALAYFRAEGIAITANTNINRLNLPELESLYAHLRAQHIESWQVQWTIPLGRAADRADLILQPWEMLDAVPRLAALKTQAYADGILLMPGNNLGYFGPEEALLRSTKPGDRDHYQGCLAGKFLMGVESNGDIKGCPSLQSSTYVRGNLRDRPIADLWPSLPPQTELWGFCRDCAFADTCRGGCTFTAHAIMGKPGNNPYCHYRARTFAADGLRERLVPAEPPPGRPFDNGRFDIVVEPLDAPDPRPGARRDLVKIRRAPPPR